MYHACDIRMAVTTQVYMCANTWGGVNYSRVASVCMNKNKRKFEEHDKERFEQYLSDVQAGKKKIASGALKPHELVQQAMQQAYGYAQPLLVCSRNCHSAIYYHCLQRSASVNVPTYCQLEPGQQLTCSCICLCCSCI